MRKYENFIEDSFAKELGKPSSSDGIKITHKSIGSGVVVTRASLDKNNSLGRASGEYLTVNIEGNDETCDKKVIKILSQTAREFLCGAKKILVVGMGNEYILSDSLGVIVAKRISVGKFNNGSEFARFCPSVASNSGLESFGLVKAVVMLFRPDAVIVVDSLCTKNEERIGRSFQITNAGIIPGSAIGNYECNLTEETLGVKVVAIGVPLVVDLFNVVIKGWQKIKPLSQEDLKAICDNYAGEIYSPKDVDFLIENASRIISMVIETLGR